MSDVQSPKGGDDAQEVAMDVATRYGSLPLRPRDDCGDGDDGSVSSLSSDGRVNNNVAPFPPPRQRPLLLIAVIALPLFLAVAWLHELIQQQTVSTTTKSSSSSSSLRHKFVSMYGRVNADRLGNEHDLTGDGIKNNEWCNANQCQCAACDGKWCAIDAPPSTAEAGSTSAGRCIWGNDGTGASSFCEAGVREGEGQVSLPSDITFADLAAFILPTYFQRCVDLCVSTIIPAVIDDTTTSTSVMPGEVAVLRKTILKTRDLLDVFSPVYPTRTLTWKAWSSSYFGKHFDREYYIPVESSSHGTGVQQVKEVAQDDLWRTLRKFLADGYRLIGEFQDLDHAQIAYTPSELDEYQQEVWAWLSGFMNFVETSRQHIFSYLSLPCNENGRKSRHSECKYAHHHVSHLFWATISVHDLPNGNLDKAKHALAKLGHAQLKRAETYLRDALSYEFVLNSTQTEISTSSPHHHRDTDAVKDESEEDSDGIVNVQEKYHNVRKELRSFLDELLLFGDLLLPRSSVIPEILRDGTSVTTTAVVAATCFPTVKILTNQAVDALETTRNMLGDLNDHYAAYEWYKERNEYPGEQLILQKNVEARWKRFRKWQEEVDLLSKMEFLRDVMMHPGKTWTFNPTTTSSDEPTLSPIKTPDTSKPTTFSSSSSQETTQPFIQPTAPTPSSGEPALSPVKSPGSHKSTTMSPSTIEQTKSPFIKPVTATPSIGESTLNSIMSPATSEPTTVSPTSSQHTASITPDTATPSSAEPTLGSMKSPVTPEPTTVSTMSSQHTTSPFI